MRISDAWRANTPEALQSAVEHIRCRFDDLLWIATSTDRECHRALTSKTRSSPEPVIFQTHFNSLAKSICSLVGKTFALLLQIAVQNQIDRPIDWACTQVTLMLEEELLLSEATRIRDWIVIACEGQDRPRPDPQLGSAAEEEWLFHRDWQSPAWLCMKPLGNFSYDSLRAWDRDSVKRSQSALGVHSNICSIRIANHLKRLAGQAEVERVLQGCGEQAPEATSDVSSPAHEFWRNRTTGIWTIRMTTISPDSVPIADHKSVNLDYLWAALKAGRGGAGLSQVANEAGIRGRPDLGAVSGRVTQTDDAGLSSETLSQPVLDSRALALSGAKMLELEAEAHKAEQEGHPDKAIGLREQANGIQRYISTQTRPNRGARRIKTDADRTANTVRQGLKRALGIIRKGNREVSRYIEGILVLEGGRCWTRCDTGDWRFYE
jgi:hypothetical protein